MRKMSLFGIWSLFKSEMCPGGPSPDPWLAMLAHGSHTSGPLPLWGGSLACSRALVKATRLWAGPYFQLLSVSLCFTWFQSAPKMACRTCCHGTTPEYTIACGSLMNSRYLKQCSSSAKQFDAICRYWQGFDMDMVTLFGYDTVPCIRAVYPTSQLAAS